ncbi:MAG: hypothetical protein SGJ03_07890 [Alphaproteobacteria bacterium]|nr:hypothetical protein [Alphaproteobacteria bacterium]
MSHLAALAQAARGQQAGRLAGQEAGPMADPAVEELARLQRENARQQTRLASQRRKRCRPAPDVGKPHVRFEVAEDRN